MTHRNRTSIVLSTTLFLVFGARAFAADSDVRKVYNSKCKIWHGEDGSGDTKMGEKLKVADLGSPEVQAKTDEELTTTIRDGKDKMPKFGESCPTRRSRPSSPTYVRSLRHESTERVQHLGGG